MSRNAGATSATRHERRLADRDDRREQRRQQRRDTRRRTAARPAWKSPMALFTIGAVAIGVVIVAVAALSQPGRQPSTDELIPPAYDIPADLASGRTLGRADAPVTVEIWSDFQCPACRDLAKISEPTVVSSLVVPGTARLVYRDAAFQGARAGAAFDESVEAAAAARCAADQGRFWEMHGWLFANWNGENRGAFAAPRLRALATAAGLDITTYDSCVAAGDKQAAARAETNEALATGVNSTPTLVINGTPISGALSAAQLMQVILQAADAAGRPT